MCTLGPIRRQSERQAGWEGLPMNTGLAEAQKPSPVFSTLKPLAMLRLSPELAG